MKTWKQYVAECRQSNVEPTRADFRGIERSYEEIDAAIARSLQKRQPKTMAASVGA